MEPAAQRWKTIGLLFADLARIDIKCIIAYELHYHRSCYCQKTIIQRPIKEVDSTIKVISNYVRERGIEDNEIIYEKSYWMLTTTVYRLKKKLWQTQDLFLRRYLKNSKKNSPYKPIYGKQFLHKESQSKGEIIIRYIKKLQQLQEKIVKIESQIKYQVRKI